MSVISCQPNSKYLGPNVWHQVLGTKYLVPRASSYQVLCAKYLVPSTYQVLGTEHLDQVLGSKYSVPSTRYQVLGTNYLVSKTWYHKWRCDAHVTQSMRAKKRMAATRGDTESINRSICIEREREEERE